MMADYISEKVLSREFSEEEISFAEALQNHYAILERLHLGEIAYTVRYISEYRKLTFMHSQKCKFTEAAA
jgi:hypothetical protein